MVRKSLFIGKKRVLVLPIEVLSQIWLARFRKKKLKKDRENDQKWKNLAFPKSINFSLPKNVNIILYFMQRRFPHPYF